MAGHRRESSKQREAAIRNLAKARAAKRGGHRKGHRKESRSHER